MWLTTAYLLILYVPPNNGIIRLYSDDVYHTLFGDLSKMNDLLTYEGTISEAGVLPEYLEKHRRRLVEEDIEDTGNDNVSNEFKKLSSKMQIMAKNLNRRLNSMNLTRRSGVPTRRDADDSILYNSTLPYDEEDLRALYQPDGWWKAVASYVFTDINLIRKTLALERMKITKVHKLMLQFLIHTRHEVGKALRQRAYFRWDKRYQLGYLFNRLRRLKTEQLKIVWHLHQRRNHTEYELAYKPQMNPRIYSLYMYEKAAAYDVDIRDTCKYIHDVFDTKTPVDYITPWVHRSSLSKTTPRPVPGPP
ncbi:uncharacterized protein LOC142983636 [Anticarsia gemmatalis]|uniref:uncharacterized protein LOC142983636 n=1 Tax=Anticarsia gemmatalis TaxID=129554 RepID=UPI003F7747EF